MSFLLFFFGWEICCSAQTYINWCRLNLFVDLYLYISMRIFIEQKRREKCRNVCMPGVSMSVVSRHWVQRKGCVYECQEGGGIGVGRSVQRYRIFLLRFPWRCLALPTVSSNPLPLSTPSSLLLFLFSHPFLFHWALCQWQRAAEKKRGWKAKEKVALLWSSGF